MSEPFLAQIIMCGFDFAPRSWAFCHGQILAINTNQSLYSLLGTTYGGDGRTTFGLPDLRGRNAIHPGNGPGLTPITLGEKVGANNVTLTVQNLPQHDHTYAPDVNSSPGNTGDPDGSYFANTGGNLSYNNGADGGMAQSTTANAGNNQPVSVMQPFIGLHYIIATQGLFPSRN